MDITSEKTPLFGPNGLWDQASASGGIIPELVSFIHRPSQRQIAVTLEFSRKMGPSHLENEVALFMLTPEKVKCAIPAGLPEVYGTRINALMPLLLPYFETAELYGNFQVSLGDEGLCSRVLSFCSIINEFLIPDPYFVSSRGYENERNAYGKVPWVSRRDELYWRGADTGVWRYNTIHDAPRVAVCLLAQAHSGLIDARITRTEPTANEARNRAYYEAEGLLGPEEDQAEILNYRYQIDIDGNTSTWSGFFLKLLTGSPVLKVTSELSWRQWYYDQLKPWEHYVPVRADLADLVEQLHWLRSNPSDAQRIGSAGRAFALSMDFDTEMLKSINTVDRLVTLNRRIRFN
ncbi:glycosyl transferase family 90 [Sphingorhabdus sp.]|uniref:glycosyl transferase family 90 n=1 Tax=Sphingorhabdus sp. TaxID=1902408 RepID=UPI00333F4C8A